MKQIKIVFWLLFFGIIGLIVYQNLEFFMNEQSVSINLFFVDEYKSPELPNAIFFLTFLLVGLLISYFHSLSGRFSSKKEIKSLKATITSSIQELSALKSEVESLKSGQSGNNENTNGSPDNTQGE